MHRIMRSIDLKKTYSCFSKSCNCMLHKFSFKIVKIYLNNNSKSIIFQNYNKHSFIGDILFFHILKTAQVTIYFMNNY